MTKQQKHEADVAESTPTATYQHEDAAPKSSGAKEFFGQRWVRITGISLAAAIALVGAFGVGVVAGERIGGNDGTSFSRDGFGGMNGNMPGNMRNFMGNNGQNGFPGGCPADDPDHCAGTDRNQHNFQLPNNGTGNSGSTTGSSTTGTKS